MVTPHWNAGISPQVSCRKVGYLVAESSQQFTEKPVDLKAVSAASSRYDFVEKGICVKVYLDILQNIKILIRNRKQVTTLKTAEIFIVRLFKNSVNSFKISFNLNSVHVTPPKPL